MHQIIRPFLCLCLVFGSFVAAQTPAASAHQPIWSKKAVSFQVFCDDKEQNACKPLQILSPDRKGIVRVSYEPLNNGSKSLSASLSVFKDGKNLGSPDLAGFVENEIVWSPDSSAFFINGNNNANGAYHFAVYRLADSGVVRDDVKDNVLEDMVRSFPPCGAKHPFERCHELESDPDDYIGTAAIDWLPDSSGIVIMAEVTCSSSMGGIMCQVLGYELQISTGKILRRMEAKEFASRWQHSMAWKFRVPDPPEYSPK